jgi:hypothetical protein
LYFESVYAREVISIVPASQHVKQVHLDNEVGGLLTGVEGAKTGAGENDDASRTYPAPAVA